VNELDVARIRGLFPALDRTVAGAPAAYVDGPAGTQVPQSVIDAIGAALATGTSNLGGAFPPSEEAATIVGAARMAVSDLLGGDPGEIVFGQNMTSLTFSLSRALAAGWGEGDEVVVTALDHDANVTPWRLAARDRGAQVRVADLDAADGTLDMASLEEAIGDRTRLVAVTAASNALGSVTPLPAIVDLARRHGALVFVDAVHYSAHRLSDVSSLGADFLVASAYKFCGPHIGIMWGRSEHLEGIPAYKVVPAPSIGPGKWETGTQSFESLAGVTATVDYLASLGEGVTRRERLEGAFAAIRRHEEALAGRFLTGVAEMPDVTVYGVSDPGRLDDRVSTFAVEVAGVPPRRVAEELGRQGIFVWDGNYYAVGVMERLGMGDRGGLVRIGFVHYNTFEEVDRVLSALDGFG
jgi:cysteine desulfurase family protein (TIGR01976 family)